MLGRLLQRLQHRPPISLVPSSRAMSSDLTARLAQLSIQLDPSAVVHHAAVQGAAQWKEALQGLAGVPDNCAFGSLLIGVWSGRTRRLTFCLFFAPSPSPPADELTKTLVFKPKVRPGSAMYWQGLLC